MGRRFGLVVALVIFGYVIYNLPSLLALKPLMDVVKQATGSLAQGPAAMAAASAMFGHLIAWALVFMLYACVAFPFIVLTFFVAYGRSRDLIGPVVAAKPEAPASIPGLGGAGGTGGRTVPPGAPPA